MGLCQGLFCCKKNRRRKCPLSSALVYGAILPTNRGIKIQFVDVAHKVIVAQGRIFLWKQPSECTNWKVWGHGHVQRNFVCRDILRQKGEGYGWRPCEILTTMLRKIMQATWHLSQA